MPVHSVQRGLGLDEMEMITSELDAGYSWDRVDIGKNVLLFNV